MGLWDTKIGEEILEIGGGADLSGLVLHTAQGYTKQVFESPDYESAWHTCEGLRGEGEDVKLHSWGAGYRVVSREADNDESGSSSGVGGCLFLIFLMAMAAAAFMN